MYRNTDFNKTIAFRVLLQHCYYCQQRASQQTVHILFLANDRCLRDYDLVVARIVDHCFSQAQLLFSWAPGIPPAKSGPAKSVETTTTTRLGRTNDGEEGDVGGRSTTVEIGGSRAGVQARVADARPTHVQRKQVVDTADREPARVVRRRAVGDVGRVEVAVDGRQDEVDVPVSVGRSPAVRRHAVQREVRLDVHQSVARTERSRPQQPRLRYDTHAHTWSAPSNTTDCITDGYADGRRAQSVMSRSC